MASVYSILIDADTRIVLAGGSRPYGIEFLRTSSPNTTEHIPFVRFPNYAEDFFFRGIPGEEMCQWTWDVRTRLFVPTKSDLLTEVMRDRSLLMRRKYILLCRFVNSLNTIRQSMNTGIYAQSTVHLMKRQEAEKVQQAEREGKKIAGADYPFVDQYAYLSQISIEQAANDIVFAAKLKQETLLFSERIRMEFFRKIRETQSAEEVADIWKEYISEVYQNSLR